MAAIYDLLEVTDISPHTTYSTVNGNLLGVVDGATSGDLNDGEFDIGDSITIGGTSYSISRIQEPLSSGRFTTGDGVNHSIDPGSESNLEAVFLTVTNGAETRHFIIPNDSYGDMNLHEIRTGDLEDVGGSDAAVISTSNNNIIIVCFAAGTRIDTPRGREFVEDLAIGDMVNTRDNGPQPLAAIISRRLDFEIAPERLKPILFEPDALGPGEPNARLIVSPQHRMLITHHTGAPVLMPAKALTGLKGVRVMRGKRSVTYYHLVFTRHEIVRANGVYSESFFPGPMALKALPAEMRAEIHEIFGEDMRIHAPALPILTCRAARQAAPLLH